MATNLDIKDVTVVKQAYRITFLEEAAAEQAQVEAGLRAQVATLQADIAALTATPTPPPEPAT